MNDYNTNLNSPRSKPVLLVFVVSFCIFTASIWIPSFTRPLGLLTAEYIENKASSEVFYWIYTCTLVNSNMTSYYSQNGIESYVDGVYMLSNGSENRIKVLFAPYTENNVREGTLSDAEWADLSDSIIHTGIGSMERATSHPDYFPHIWLIDLLMEVYFNDNTLFYMGFSKSDGLVYIQYGTWSGGFTDYGWPEVTGYAGGSDWLIANGHLDNALVQIIDRITKVVPLTE